MKPSSPMKLSFILYLMTSGSIFLTMSTDVRGDKDQPTKDFVSAPAIIAAQLVSNQFSQHFTSSQDTRGLPQITLGVNFPLPLPFVSSLQFNGNHNISQSSRQTEKKKRGGRTSTPSPSFAPSRPLTGKSGGEGRAAPQKSSSGSGAARHNKKSQFSNAVVFQQSASTEKPPKFSLRLDSATRQGSLGTEEFHTGVQSQRESTSSLNRETDGYFPTKYKTDTSFLPRQSGERETPASSPNTFSQPSFPHVYSYKKEGGTSFLPLPQADTHKPTHGRGINPSSTFSNKSNESSFLGNPNVPFYPAAATPEKLKGSPNNPPVERAVTSASLPRTPPEVTPGHAHSLPVVTTNTVAVLSSPSVLEVTSPTSPNTSPQPDTHIVSDISPPTTSAQPAQPTASENTPVAHASVQPQPAGMEASSSSAPEPVPAQTPVPPEPPLLSTLMNSSLPNLFKDLPQPSSVFPISLVLPALPLASIETVLAPALAPVIELAINPALTVINPAPVDEFVPIEPTPAPAPLPMAEPERASTLGPVPVEPAARLVPGLAPMAEPVHAGPVSVPASLPAAELSPVEPGSVEPTPTPALLPTSAPEPGPMPAPSAGLTITATIHPIPVSSEELPSPVEVPEAPPLSPRTVGMETSEPPPPHHPPAPSNVGNRRAVRLPITSNQNLLRDAMTRVTARRASLADSCESLLEAPVEPPSRDPMSLDESFASLRARLMAAQSHHVLASASEDANESPSHVPPAASPAESAAAHPFVQPGSSVVSLEDNESAPEAPLPPSPVAILTETDVPEAPSPPSSPSLHPNERSENPRAPLGERRAKPSTGHSLTSDMLAAHRHNLRSGRRNRVASTSSNNNDEGKQDLFTLVSQRVGKTILQSQTPNDAQRDTVSQPSHISLPVQGGSGKDEWATD